MRRIFGFFLLALLSFNSFSQETVKPKQPDLPGELMIDYGFNLFNQKMENFPLKFWGSNSFGIYYNSRIRINDHFAFHPSWGLTSDKYAFTENYTWLRGADGVVRFDSLQNVAIGKNKLVVNYFEVPLEIRFHPLGTVHGEGWFMGVGVIGGMKFNAHTKLKYVSANDEIKEKLYSGFDLPTFRYGVQARFGFKTFHLFYKMYLNDLWKNTPDVTGNNPNPFTVGVTFSGF